MTDRYNFSEPTQPQALNGQFFLLYELLPPRREFDWDNLRWKRPDNPELKTQILDKLGELLTQAQITDAFKHYIVMVFGESFDYGVIKEGEVDREEMTVLWGQKAAEGMHRDALYDTIIMNSVKSGGIFDPVEAKEIERKAYQRDLMGTLLVQYMSQRRHQNMGRQGQYKPDPEAPRVKRIQTWRKPFIERYGD